MSYWKGYILRHLGLEREFKDIGQNLRNSGAQKRTTVTRIRVRVTCVYVSHYKKRSIDRSQNHRSEAEVCRIYWKCRELQITTIPTREELLQDHPGFLRIRKIGTKWGRPGDLGKLNTIHDWNWQSWAVMMGSYNAVHLPECSPVVTGGSLGKIRWRWRGVNCAPLHSDSECLQKVESLE